MIILYIRGGLGNQLSQLAYALVLSKRLGDDLYIDTTSYNRYKIRNYSVKNLVIGEKLKYLEDSNIPAHKYKALRIERSAYHLFEKIITVFKGEVGKKTFIALAKRGRYYNFDSTYYGYPVSSKKVIDVYGYYLAEKYFTDYKDLLTKLFTVSSEQTENENFYLELIQKSNSVAISMRLQDDYVNNTVTNVCTNEYFRTGVQYIKEKVENAKFFVFADDIDRAQNMDLGIKPIYIKNMKDYQGLRLLYSCRHYIISNSSFSWWGAYLSRNNEKIVVAPKKWMNTDRIDYEDKYYDNMIRL